MISVILWAGCDPRLTVQEPEVQVGPPSRSQSWETAEQKQPGDLCHSLICWGQGSVRRAGRGTGPLQPLKGLPGGAFKVEEAGDPASSATAA